jgi:N-acetylglucosamine-6-phosphate deacetylase
MGPPKDNVQKAILAERVFDGLCWLEDTAVLTEGGRVQGLSRWGDVPAGVRQQRLPAGIFLAPGFIDLQVNGGGGVLLNDRPSAETIRDIARAHRRLGTTALLPTLITDKPEKIAAAITAVSEIAGSDGVLGLHLEGPFINPVRAGVHRRDCIAHADMRDLERLSALGQAGHSLVTLAPECAPEGMIRSLVQSGVRVSLGHSEATAEIVMRAVEEGATGITHLFNAMPALHSRAPGLVGVALSEPRLIAGLIVDGIHVDPVTVRAAFAAKGPDAIALVSDAMPTVGSKMKTFNLMGRAITLGDGRLTTSDGTLAGAHLDMASAVRNAVNLCGIPLENALQAATLTPARFLGVEDECGQLVANARADFLALTDELRVVACWVGGVEQSGSPAVI